MALTKFTAEFGAWEPDSAIFNGQQAPVICNVIPAARGYSAMKGLVPLIYNALPSRVYTGFTHRKIDSTLLTYAMTVGNIYALENSVWTSKYSDTVASDTRAMVAYGDNMYALFGDNLIKGTVAGGITTFAAVSGAPTGEVIGVVRDFLMLGRTTADGDNAVHWSAINDPDSWPTVGTDAAQFVQSDVQVFPEGGGIQSIVGGIGNGVDGLIFLERAIHRATYIGTPYVFKFDVVDRQHGCLAPRSPVVCGNACVFLADDGWRITDGTSTKSIGAERIDSWFFNECGSGRYSEIQGAHDAQRRLAVWVFPSENAPEHIFDRILIYNYHLDRWSYGIIDTETLCEGVSRGFTLDELDQFGDLDNLPFSSLDDPFLRERRNVISAFGHDHKLAQFAGPALAATLETAEFGGERVMLHGLRPLVDRGDAVAGPLYRDRQRDERRGLDPTPQERDGVCYHHLSTVYIAAHVEIPAGDDFVHAVGVEALYEPEGGM